MTLEEFTESRIFPKVRALNKSLSAQHFCEKVDVLQQECSFSLMANLGLHQQTSKLEAIVRTVE